MHKQASSALTLWHFFFASRYKPSLQAVHCCPLFVQVAQVAWAHCSSGGQGERGEAQTGGRQDRASSKQATIAGQFQSAASISQVQSLAQSLAELTLWHCLAAFRKYPILHLMHAPLAQVKQLGVHCRRGCGKEERRDFQ